MRQLYLPMPVWDLPIRLFHWAIVVLVLCSWGTAEWNYMSWHKLSGYSILTLLLFRIIWGFVGSDTARFSHFLKGPVTVLRYIGQFAKREPDRQVGHNAAGGWMVVVLILLLLFQACTGLASNDDVSVEGPYAYWVGKDWSDYASHLHGLTFKLIEIAVAIHILAAFTYLILKGQNLIRPMVTGKKRLPGNTRAPTMMHPLLALVVLAVSAGIVTALVRFAP
jgi:cytochrome b